MSKVIQGRLVYCGVLTTIVDDEQQEEQDIMYELEEYDGKQIRVTIDELPTDEDNKVARLRELVWGMDIPHPTTPEYLEHHIMIQGILDFIDKEMMSNG